MAGFDNTPPASEFRKNTSWGRTRQAKNLRGDNTLETATPTDAPSAVTEGYATEGQRYLHMFFKESGNQATTITVYALTYAFGGSNADWYVLQTGGSNATIVGDDGTTIKVADTAIDIKGVDRLYFRTSHALVANDEFYAAVNTLPTS